jgi:ABC-type sugar transport system substrate-binding protein
MRRLNRTVVVVAALVVASFGVAACGSSSTTPSSSSSSSSSSTTSSSTSSASTSGAKSPGTHTIGVIPSTSTSENLAVWIAQLKATMAPLGWTVVVCDGAGVVTKMEGCAESLVAQKVSAIVTMALGGPEIPGGFKQAAAAHIPVMAEGTTVTPGYEKNYTGGVYADDIVKLGCATASYISTHLASQPIIGEQITQNYGGQGYINGLVACLKKKNLKFTDLRDTDLANITNSMTANAQAIIQKNPGKATFIDFSDFAASLFEPVFSRAGRNKTITLITRYDDPTTVKLMRAGDNILVQTTKDWQHIFDMTNAMLANFNGGTPFPPNSQTVTEPGAGVFGISQFPAGAGRVYPFAPALKAQLAIWGKTWKLQPSSLTAP